VCGLVVHIVTPPLQAPMKSAHSKGAPRHKAPKQRTQLEPCKGGMTYAAARLVCNFLQATLIASLSACGDEKPDCPWMEGMRVSVSGELLDRLDDNGSRWMIVTRHVPLTSPCEIEALIGSGPIPADCHLGPKYKAIGFIGDGPLGGDVLRVESLQCE
jgi:hypothetical protein